MEEGRRRGRIRYERELHCLASEVGNNGRLDDTRCGAVLAARERAGCSARDTGFACYAKGTIEIEITDSQGPVVDTPVFDMEERLIWYYVHGLKSKFTTALKGEPGRVP